MSTTSWTFSMVPFEQYPYFGRKWHLSHKVTKCPILKRLEGPNCTHTTALYYCVSKKSNCSFLFYEYIYMRIGQEFFDIQLVYCMSIKSYPILYSTINYIKWVEISWTYTL